MLLNQLIVTTEDYRKDFCLYKNFRYLDGYFNEYAAARNPPRLCPSKIILSNPIFRLHSSIDSTNWFSATSASVSNCGLLLRPNPKRSNAYTVLFTQRSSKFRAQSPTPPPNPWRRTRGVFCERFWENVSVHILFPLDKKTYCLLYVHEIPEKRKTENLIIQAITHNN